MRFIQSSVWESSSTVSTCCRIRPYIVKFTKRFCGVWLTQCKRRDESFADQIVAVSPRECTNSQRQCAWSQRTEHSAVPGRKDIAVPEWLPYSLDLLSCKFFLFLKFNGIMKGRHFEGVETIKGAVTIEKGILPEFHWIVADNDGKMH